MSKKVTKFVCFYSFLSFKVPISGNEKVFFYFLVQGGTFHMGDLFQGDEGRV